MSKDHLSIILCGHVDAGKSTNRRLIFELKGIKEREMEKLREEAKQSREKNLLHLRLTDNKLMSCERCNYLHNKRIFTDNYHYSIIDAPGHKDFIKNMITGASQANVALIVVPDGNFTASIAKGNHKAGEIQGQTRQHARLINLLGVKQVIISVNGWILMLQNIQKNGILKLQMKSKTSSNVQNGKRFY